MFLQNGQHKDWVSPRPGLTHTASHPDRVSPRLCLYLSLQKEGGPQKKLKKEENDAESKKKKLAKEKETTNSQAEDQDSGVEVYFREKGTEKKDKAKKKVR